MQFKDVQAYLDSFSNYERDANYSYSNFKIERVKGLLEELGNPQDRFKSIHIAGTKGKGSTCAVIFSILKEAGYKVGLYISPHLINFRERIKLGYSDETEEARERLISEEEICQLVEEVKPYVDKIDGLTFFEVYTALAFKFFARENVEFAVLETGLGGRLDATNVAKPLVCGLTNISYDHMHILGKTLEQIAKEKAGIIKENSLVVTVPQSPEVWRVINKACQEKKARLYEVGRDFLFDPVGQNLDGSIFDFRGIFDNYENLHIPLLGQHQLVNATLALGIIQLLRLHDIVISFLAIKKGLNNTRWPGRLHIIHKNPFLVLDGAQNAASARALKTAIGMLFVFKKLILILGVSKDKDVQGICENLCRQSNLIILTQVPGARALEVETLEKTAAKFNKNIKKTINVAQAITVALENAGAQDLILVTGSLYLVGEVLKIAPDINFPNTQKEKK